MAVNDLIKALSNLENKDAEIRIYDRSTELYPEKIVAKQKTLHVRDGNTFSKQKCYVLVREAE